ncbi:aspartyl-phosphate phosphatase Spo0E family protein [Calderihabitans maritimus]|uniref:Spo0E like sporulation regulatory protein n=1 Tax=Calderihabitans maritimus TaxID=1246530 RepID=A0A1Z5HNI0_9FIRM|nr:aspartyl-phosphate phosphatase Spo0E family protein [Calderihabitans maritimus]GAW90937.1 hypothetical protein KKC1_00990 [Calderihabitans maritimus]
MRRKLELIEREIESLREELTNLVGNDLKKLQDPQVVEVNAKLDKLIAIYSRLKLDMHYRKERSQ